MKALKGNPDLMAFDHSAGKWVEGEAARLILMAHMDRMLADGIARWDAPLGRVFEQELAKLRAMGPAVARQIEMGI